MSESNGSAPEIGEEENRRPDQPETGLFDWLWKFFGDAKVAIVLLILIAAGSFLGAIITQNVHREVYVRKLGISIYSLVSNSFLNSIFKVDYDVDPEKYVEAFGSQAYGILHTLGWTHVFTSWWYLGLLSMIMLSIFVCSFNRLAKILQNRGGKLRDYRPDSILRYSKSFRAEAAGVREGEALVEKALSKARYTVRKSAASDSKINFEARKGELRHWGSFITHVSFLVLLLGIVIGLMGGYKSYAQISVGKSYYEPKGGFWLRLNDFTIEYDKMLRPLEYTSSVSVFEDGKEILKKDVEVNHPLIYKGVYFYQSSFGTEMVELKLRSGGNSESILMRPGEPATFATNFPSLYFARDDVFADKNNPRIFMRTVDRGGSVRSLGWLTKKKPMKMGGYTLEIGQIWQYTGLQIKKDPGVPVIWFGCTIMVIGMFMTFYIRPRRIFGTVHADGEKIFVSAAGAAGKGDDGFVAEFAKIAETLGANVGESKAKSL